MYSSDKAERLRPYVQKYGIQFVSRVKYKNLRDIYPRFTELNDRILLSIYGFCADEDECFDLSTTAIEIISLIDRAETIAEVEFQVERFWFLNRQLQSLYLRNIEHVDEAFLEKYFISATAIIESVVRPKASDVIYDFMKNNVH